jgi:hypothetical protein
MRIAFAYRESRPLLTLGGAHIWPPRRACERSSAKQSSDGYPSGLRTPCSILDPIQL